MNRPIFWTQNFFEVGNAYGYSYHNRMMREHVSRLTELSKDADVALTIQPADKFHPVPRKYNILFTMFEADALPKTYLQGIDKADEIVVPCRFARDLFRKYTRKKISVCFEGVESESFSYKERFFNPSAGKFRILWVGAPNPRKGYPVMIELCRVLEQFPEIEIYLKTTVPKVDYEKAGKSITPKLVDQYQDSKRLAEIALGEIKPLHGLFEQWGKHKNIIFDSRNLSQAELAALYQSAHCFVFPSVGEGWGLTLCEAMSTGLPCIAPTHTAMSEYFDDSVGYTIGYRIEKTQFKNYDLEANVFIPSADDALAQILHIHNDYESAKKKGRRASDRMRTKFTWPAAAQRLVEIVNESRVEALAA